MPISLENSAHTVDTATNRPIGVRHQDAARRCDGRRNGQLSGPGTKGAEINPEQRLAAGWSACFGTAMSLVARKLNVRLPEDLAIRAEVDLDRGPGGFFVTARLSISVPGIERATAQALVDEAHETCPYFKAVEGNVEVTVTLI